MADGYGYEADENPKRKHKWDRDEAGFVKGPGGEIVAKCPSSMTNPEAETLLAGGIPWSAPRWGKTYPQRIYVVYKGVVFRATPTNPGRSYHGFPELREKLPPDRALHVLLERRADELGCGDEVRAWLR